MFETQQMLREASSELSLFDCELQLPPQWGLLWERGQEHTCNNSLSMRSHGQEEDGSHPHPHKQTSSHFLISLVTLGTFLFFPSKPFLPFSFLYWVRYKPQVLAVGNGLGEAYENVT
jgi:hypothetical protein